MAPDSGDAVSRPTERDSSFPSQRDESRTASRQLRYGPDAPSRAGHYHNSDTVVYAGMKPRRAREAAGSSWKHQPRPPRVATTALLGDRTLAEHPPLYK